MGGLSLCCVLAITIFRAWRCVLFYSGITPYHSKASRYQQCALALLDRPQSRLTIGESQVGRLRTLDILPRREDVNPDKLYNMGRTALSYATENGHGRAVKILL